MLRVGDKLLCKKNYNRIKKNDYRNGRSPCKIKKNEYYIITNIDISFYFFVDNYWYSLDPNSNWYLWEYFYTPQEIRKMKLERLKQC